ncbi:MAG: T9SS type A sorting domain-containing protein [Crocinitomicaceae bacterium]|nr:T9SS type A sorting domain-containing protein [Crocinitomicaceae bacterium]
MKNLILIVSLALFIANSYSCFSQVVFGSETFSTGAAQGTSASGFVGDLGTWTVASSGANGASANNWYVSGEECGTAAGNCGSACSGGNNTLHVSAIGGLCGVPDCGAAYDETFASNQTNKRAISPTIDCTGLYSIGLNFNYIAAQGDDGFWVEYSLNNGVSWTIFPGGNVPSSGCCCLLAGLCTNFFDPTPCSDFFSGQGYWSTANLTFPVGADNNSVVKFAFNWSNNGNGIGTDPSVAIDDITLTYDIILAVDLLDFSADSKGRVNTIKWTTASESNNDHFEIEHSVDGRLFTSVGSVPSKANSSNETIYQFDHLTSTSINYYRLKVVDRNGDFSYSKSISTKNDLNEIGIYSSENSILVTGLGNYRGQIEIYDLSGKRCLDPIAFMLEDSMIEIPSTQLNSGIYLINVSTSGTIHQFKISKF